jgi:hypothetical protein
VSFFLAHGRWPDPCGCHSCDNRPCCNPAHIWEGTRAANMKDCQRKGRIARGSQNGQAKMKESQVRQALKWRSKGWTYKRIATRLNVPLSTVGHACDGNTWKHLR